MFNRRQFLVGTVSLLAASAGCRLQPLNGDKRADGGLRPYRIALLSDTHAEAVGSLTAVAINGKILQATKDLKSFRPDLWVVNGDVTNHGYLAEYSAFRGLMAGVARPEELVVTTGNHEFYDRQALDDEALDRFRTAFGQPEAYSSRLVGGVHLVMLATEQCKTAPRNPDWAWLTPNQVQWFDRVLNERRDRFTIVCMHQPLQDTVLGTDGGNGFAGCGQYAELMQILSRNPQVKLWFSGHTHLRQELPGQQVARNGVTYVAAGSTFYEIFPLAGGALGERRDPLASQSRFIQIWPDRVVVRSRDHTAGEWLSGHDITVRR